MAFVETRSTVEDVQAVDVARDESPTGNEPSIDLVTISTYASGQEASIAKNALTDAGVASYIIGDEAVSMLWYVGSALGGVKLQVARADVQRAKEVLNQAQETADSATMPAWICPNCGSEVDTGFEMCWSCSFTPEGDSVSAVPMEQAQHVSVEEPADEHKEPHKTSTESGEAIAHRAWRAAIFGIAFPPLLLYSIYLISKAYQHDLSPGAQRKTYFAMVVIAGMFAWHWIFFLILAR